MVINCKYCNKEFNRAKSKINNYENFCSRECYNKSRAIYSNCEYCGKEFKTQPYLIKQGYGIYCSRSCRNKGRLKKYPHIIEINKKCFDEARKGFKGKNHPAWKGGVSKINERIRKSKKMKEWREAVFMRDNYTCQDCHKKGGVLNAHHIVLFSTNKKLATDINNGTTLCEECHKKRHKKDSVVWGIIGRNVQLKTA